MTFPRYPEYKDSGVEWLGEVPGHWGVRKARWLCQIKKRIASELGHEVLSITQQGIRVRDLESNDGQLSMDYSKYQIVEVGDFAMNHMDLLTGYVDIANVPGVTSPDYRVFSIRNPAICYDNYLLYLFQMGYKNKIFYAYGQGSSQLGRWRMPTERFYELAFPLPPTQEQVQIAVFLDRETAKIDALVAEQRRLMALLKEKRQAVISHAVTRGLNPDAPMKPSGIEWLGDVPAHWEVSSFRHCLNSMFNGLTATQVDEAENTVPVTRIETISHGVIDESRLGYISSDEARADRQLLPGDILFSNINSLNMVGKCAFYESGRKIYAGMNLLVLRPEPKKCSPLWLCWLVRSARFRCVVESLSKPAINQASISQSSINSISVAVPHIGEQEEIQTYLNAETAKFDTLTTAAQCAIDLLQERRTALIAAAVTGQIDIRGLQ